jgi:PAS domain S-box-containing protein
MTKKLEQFSAKNPNPVLSVANDGTVIYSNEAGESLLDEWGVGIGEKLPLGIGDLVQRVISRNNPEKMEVKAGNRIYLLAFHPLFEDECVNIYGFDISDQKELENKLRESEEKFRQLAENIEEVFFVFTPDWKQTIYVSPAYERIWGRPLKDVYSNSMVWLEGVHPDDRGLALAVVNKYIEGNFLKTDSVEFRVLRPVGVSKWILACTYPILDKEGRVSRIIGIAEDITMSKLAEEALKKEQETLEVKIEKRTKELEEAYKLLKESEERLAEAQKIAHIGNWDWNIVTNELYWSDEIYRIFGCNPQEFGATYDAFLSYVHPEDRESVKEAVVEALKGKPYSIDHRIILAGGEECVVHEEGKVVFNYENIPVRMIGAVQDITERKKAEEEIQNLANVVESSNDAIITLSLDGIVTSWNRSAEQIYGYSPEEIIGKRASTPAPVHLKGETINLIKKVKLGEKVQNYETTRIRKDGKKIYVSIALSPVYNIHNKLVAVSAITRDITERIEAEESLAKVENARKKEIHHRIKNNLQVISSLLDLQADKFNDKKVVEAFRESQNRVISMALIHEELHKGEKTDILNFCHYLQELVTNLFSIYRLDSQNVHLCMDLEENTFFNTDIAVPLGIIVNELVSNSLKYAFPDRNNGKILILLHGEDKKECKIGDNSTNYVLSISDNGVGIPDNLDIENPDSLGLQLVTALVDQIDGELKLKRDNGTQFTINFTV